MKRVVIFGVADAARLVCQYLRYDTDFIPVAYAVTRQFMPTVGELDGIPVVEFDAVTTLFPPSECCFIAPMSYRSHNSHRARIFGEIRTRGYMTINYVSSRAVVAPGVRIGTNTVVLEGSVISPCCAIGDDVMIQAGCTIAHGVAIGDHAFLAPGVVVAGAARVGPYAFVGAGAVIRDRIHLGEGSFVAMGSVVRSDTREWTHYDGNPARPCLGPEVPPPGRPG